MCKYCNKEKDYQFIFERKDLIIPKVIKDGVAYITSLPDLEIDIHNCLSINDHHGLWAKK